MLILSPIVRLLFFDDEMYRRRRLRKIRRRRKLGLYRGSYDVDLVESPENPLIYVRAPI